MTIDLLKKTEITDARWMASAAQEGSFLGALFAVNAGHAKRHVMYITPSALPGVIRTAVQNRSSLAMRRIVLESGEVFYSVGVCRIAPEMWN